MSQPEQLDILILGSGKSGKLLAWHMAQAGRRTAVVERRWVGGSCPNIACMPSKNEIWGARIAHLVHHAAQFGTVTGAVTTDMSRVRQRKREMVEREVAFHLERYKSTGAELIMGSGRFIAPKTLEVQLDLFGDYKSNVALYPAFQAYFRTCQPRFLAAWGRNDPFFLPAGAEAFRRDIPDAKVRFFDTGHFALETHASEIAAAIRDLVAP